MGSAFYSADPNDPTSVSNDMTYDFSDNPNVRVGMGIVAFMGVQSFIGSAILLGFSIAKLFAREDYDPLQPVSAMFMYWIVCDMIQALARISTFRWALSGVVKEGAYCRTQSAFEQIGNFGAALCVMIISLLVLVRITRPSLITTRPRQISLILVALTTLILILLILVPSTVIKGYYGDTDLWCWIVDKNGTTSRLRIGTEYALLWSALATETLVYGYFLLRKLAHTYHWFGITSPSFDSITFSATLGMFWYAVAYAVEVIPISIIRMRQFQHHDIPHGWDTVALTLGSAAGFVNAILFFSTGRRFGFSDGRRRGKKSSHELQPLEMASHGSSV